MDLNLDGLTGGTATHSTHARRTVAKSCQE